MNRRSKTISYSTFLRKYEEEILSAGTLSSILITYPDLALDLAKVQFSLENYQIDAIGDWGSEYGIRKCRIRDGFFYAVSCFAGGDWEFPVSFIIYMDEHERWRGYIPKRGNVWNFETKAALGNDEDADRQFMATLGWDAPDNLEEVDCVDYGEFLLSYTHMSQDIYRRFELVHV